MNGGYTGNIGISEIAGVVHGREFVMDAASTSRIGVGSLQLLKRGDATIQQPSYSPASQQTEVINSQPVINIALVDSDEKAREWLSGRGGEQIVLNQLRNNREEVSSIVRGVA
ncbi:hypothetical protein J3U08_01045 [Gilliamella sp. B2894]|uniref:hypothetical protein n=1 Tax=unclassified Gilliamella TaxID=2685620 RepID=UPI00226AC269|nr:MULTISPECIES: hypothetical protein [unclassified Gilliamella]MCX8655376.1 hypothetical protein [Gilliamella sp. B2894]MCX8693907.1 hypothetical protein [Gilliamella sp. B2881]MCX8695376.1 hypothetical protein [Gilliamella sp. B2828]